MNEFYKFIAEAGEEPDGAELLIFSTIGDWEDMGEVSAKVFSRDLAALPKSVKRLDIHINSPGGSLFEASAIYSRLADHPSKKIVYVDGLAASAASVIAMVGHKIYIRANASMMIHLPSGIVMGNADDMRTMAGALDTVTESMINVYARRTKQERAKLRDMLAAETWFSPDSAVENGFADEVRGVVKAAALDQNRVIFNGIEHDLSRFHNVPAFNASTTTKENTMPNKPKVKAEKKEEDENGNGNGDGGEHREEHHEEHHEETRTPTQPKPQTPAPGPATREDPAGAKAETDFDRGVQAERERVTALQALDRPATHEIVTAAIKDGKQPADIAADCIAAMDKAGTQNARRMDASSLNNIPPSEGGAEGDNGFGGKIKSAVNKVVKARSGRRGVVVGRN